MMNPNNTKINEEPIKIGKSYRLNENDTPPTELSDAEITLELREEMCEEEEEEGSE